MKRTSHVVIVGAGVIGCAVAYELARRGTSVQVVDPREVGQGATQASAGVLAPYLRAHEGSSLLELAARSLHLYDEFITRVMDDSGLKVQYCRTGTLEVATDEAGVAGLIAMSERCIAKGIAVEYLDKNGIHKEEPQLTDQILGGLLVHPHGFVGAADLIKALKVASGNHGAKFLNTASVIKVWSEDNGFRVQTSTEDFVCNKVVLAAGSWSSQVEVAGEEAIPIRPVRGQLLHLDCLASMLKRVVWAEDSYLVPWSDGSVLAGATVEEVGFDERATAAGIRQIIDMTCKLIPKAKEARFKEVRVGLRPGTPDDLPVIGPSVHVHGLIYATGHFRNGILLAPLTAALISNFLLEHKSDEVLKFTSPSRFEQYTRIK